MDNQWLEDDARYINLVRESRRIAHESVVALNLPLRIDTPRVDFSKLGNKVETVFNQTLGGLNAKHGANLPQLMAVALRESWYGFFYETLYVRFMSQSLDVELPNELEKIPDPPDTLGLADNLYFGCPGLYADSGFDLLRAGTCFITRPSPEDLGECMALQWFANAAAAFDKGEILEGCNWLSEANISLYNIFGEYMWLEGKRLTLLGLPERDLIQARTDFARKGGNARHWENKEMKAQVFNWADTNMPNGKSLDATAEELAGKGKLVPLTFRTVRYWLGEWKKLRSAGTP